jgi:type VI protein secretion system component VasF
MTENNDSILTKAVDDEMHQVLEARFKRELKQLEDAVGKRRFAPSRWIAEILLFVLIAFNGFIGYQLWQQSQHLSELVKQFAPVG